jgi:hypothetical protein
MPLSIMAQIDYNYNRVDSLSPNKPTKIMWVTKSQAKQSVSFDHLIFFVTPNESITGDKVILNIYHNKELIHTKEFTTMSEAPNSVYLLSPINLKRKDQLYITLTLKPNTNSINTSYLVSIKDRTTFLRKNPEQYREMLKYEVSPTQETSTTQTNYQYSKSKGMFGETYDPNKPRKKKHKMGTGWIDVLGIVTGL